MFPLLFLKTLFPGCKTPPPLPSLIQFYLNPIAMTPQFLNTFKKILKTSLFYSILIAISFSKIHDEDRTKVLHILGSII